MDTDVTDTTATTIPFWRDRPVTVTGGAGFLGCYLVKQLYQAGANITVLDNYSASPTRLVTIRHGKAQIEIGYATQGYRPVNDRLRYLARDCTSREQVANTFLNYPPSILFNLAARVAGVEYNRAHHAEMFYYNLLTQTVPLIAAQSLRPGILNTLVQISSVCVYGTDATQNATENNLGTLPPAEANQGYSAAKRAGEQLTLWLSHNANQQGANYNLVIRLSNMYGPWDNLTISRTHVIPALIQRVLRSDPSTPLLVYGNKNTSREFLYVEDAATGLMRLVEVFKSRYGIFNLGAREQITLSNLATQILTICNQKDREVHYLDNLDSDSMRWSDCSRLRNLIGWQPETAFAAGLKKTVSWVQKQLQ